MKMGEDISGKGKSLATTMENQTDGSEDFCQILIIINMIDYLLNVYTCPVKKKKSLF